MPAHGPIYKAETLVFSILGSKPGQRACAYLDALDVTCIQTNVAMATNCTEDDPILSQGSFHQNK